MRPSRDLMTGWLLVVSSLPPRVLVLGLTCRQTGSLRSSPHHLVSSSRTPCKTVRGPPLSPAFLSGTSAPVKKEAREAGAAATAAAAAAAGVFPSLFARSPASTGCCCCCGCRRAVPLLPVPSTPAAHAVSLPPHAHLSMGRQSDTGARDRIHRTAREGAEQMKTDEFDGRRRMMPRRQERQERRARLLSPCFLLFVAPALALSQTHLRSCSGCQAARRTHDHRRRGNSEDTGSGAG